MDSPDALPRVDVLAVQRAFADATRAGDADAIAAMSAPGCVVWHNYDDAETDVGRAGRTLRWLHRTMPDVSWSDVAVLPTPTGFVWQSILTGMAPGGGVRAHSCVVVSLAADGQILRTEEYLDPAALQAITGKRAVET